ncbi:hypothetical protein MKW98_032020, partial [Papaver atlanticum]
MSVESGDESVSSAGLHLASASQDELEHQKLETQLEKNAGSSSFILSGVDFFLGGYSTTLDNVLGLGLCGVEKITYHASDLAYSYSKDLFASKHAAETPLLTGQFNLSLAP